MTVSSALGLKTLAVIVGLLIGQAEAGLCYADSHCGPREVCSSKFQCTEIETSVTPQTDPATPTSPLTNTSFEIQLLDRIDNLERNLQAQNATIANIGKELNDQKANNTALEVQLKNQERILQAQNERLEKQAQQYKELATNISVSSHVESGSVYCGGPFGQGGGHNDPLDKHIPLTFTRAYTSPPTVAVAVVEAKWEDDTDGEFMAVAHTVTQDGFTLRCGAAWSSTHLDYLAVTWVAHPQP